MKKYTVKNRKKTYKKRNYAKKKTRKKIIKIKGGFLGFYKGDQISTEKLQKINENLESTIGDIRDVNVVINKVGFRKYKITSNYKENHTEKQSNIVIKTQDYNKLLKRLKSIKSIRIDITTGLTTEYFVKNSKDLMNCTDMLFFTSSSKTIKCMEGTINMILNYQNDWESLDYENICEEINTMQIKYICNDELKDNITQTLEMLRTDDTQGGKIRYKNFNNKIKCIKLSRYITVLKFLRILKDSNRIKKSTGKDSNQVKKSGSVGKGSPSTSKYLILSK